MMKLTKILAISLLTIATVAHAVGEFSAIPGNYKLSAGSDRACGDSLTVTKTNGDLFIRFGAGNPIRLVNGETQKSEGGRYSYLSVKTAEYQAVIRNLWGSNCIFGGYFSCIHRGEQVITLKVNGILLGVETVSKARGTSGETLVRCLYYKTQSGRI
jgi:hypothetical protein